MSEEPAAYCGDEKKKSKKTSPTERTIAWAKKEGWLVGKTEHWNPFVPRGDGGMGIRQDLFNCIDMIVIHPNRRIMGIQACAYASFSARKAKSIALPALRVWLQSGARFCVVGWKGKQVGKRMIWTPRCEEIFEKDLPFAPPVVRDESWKDEFVGPDELMEEIAAEELAKQEKEVATAGTLF